MYNLFVNYIDLDISSFMFEWFNIDIIVKEIEISIWKLKINESLGND